MSAGSAQAVVTQGITGTLSAEGAAPVSGALNIYPVDPTVHLTGADYTISPLGGSGPGDHGPTQFWETDQAGHFSIALPDGDYWVHFVMGGPPTHANVWWGGSANRQGSTKVTVAAGQLTENVDQVLPIAGSITGTIAQAGPAHDGTPDGIVEAWVPDSTFPDGMYLVASGQTNDDGTYTVEGLPSASYRVHFITRYTQLEGWWQDQATMAAATPLNLTAPSTVSGIDPTLKPWGLFTGKVTRAADATPVSGAYIDLVDATDGGYTYWSQTDTAADGTYSLKVPAGSYKLLFHTPSSTLASEYWNNAATRADAQFASVITDQSTPGIDVALEPTAVVNKTRPVIAGTRRVGSTLSVSDGNWYPGGASDTYQWFRNGSLVSGAVNKTYTVGAADLGKNLVARVTAAKNPLLPTTSSSDATAPIAPGIFALSGSPGITGITRVGRVLHAVRQTTSPASVATYQWLRNGKAIPGISAKKANYTLRAADKGQRVGVRITLRRPGYAAVVRTVTRSARVR